MNNLPIYLLHRDGIHFIAATIFKTSIRIITLRLFFPYPSCRMRTDSCFMRIKPVGVGGSGKTNHGSVCQRNEMGKSTFLTHSKVCKRYEIDTLKKRIFSTNIIKSIMSHIQFSITCTPHSNNHKIIFEKSRRQFSPFLLGPPTTISGRVNGFCDKISSSWRDNNNLF